MFVRKLSKILVITLAAVFAGLLLFSLLAIGFVDRRPVSNSEYYARMKAGLDTIDVKNVPSSSGFSVGFSKISITPPRPVATAGYGKRKGKPYTNVHDSVFVRAIVIGNGAATVAIVSADLLIIPPTVTKKLRELMAGSQFDLNNTYLTATHSHNSIGHWGEGLTTFMYGDYNDSIVNAIASAIVRSIDVAESEMLPSTIFVGSVEVGEAVQNRLIDGGPEDPFLRVMEVRRSDGTRAVLTSFQAHATCLSQSNIVLSNDYPGILLQKLDSSGYDLAMFAAGGVGSHTTSAPRDDFKCMEFTAETLYDHFMDLRSKLTPMSSAVLGMQKVPLLLGDPQIRVTEDLKVRSWLVRAALGRQDPFLTVLRIGDLVMLGTPCDFSGELTFSIDSLAQQKNLQVMVTSFNGSYIGYVTPQKYYDVDHYETRLMNWYAPGTGEYLSESLRQLLTAASDTN